MDVCVVTGVARESEMIEGKAALPGDLSEEEIDSAEFARRSSGDAPDSHDAAPPDDGVAIGDDGWADDLLHSLWEALMPDAKTSNEDA